jgi:hypothetical protein
MNKVFTARGCPLLWINPKGKIPALELWGSRKTKNY